MTRLVMLFFFILVSRLANAQAINTYGMKSKNESNFEENDIIKIQKTVPSSQTINDKNPTISSAARKSTIINKKVIEGQSTQKIDKDSDSPKSASQARRPTTGRPVQITLPVVLVPAIAKPTKMTIPNRRISLPIGK